MKITSAKFIKGIVGPDELLNNEIPQIAFIGRSNAGKSSLLNSLTNAKKLALTSKTPGRTREINVFLVNETHYFMDLPGYGYAKAGGDTIKKIGDLISWYLFESHHDPKVVVLVDANIGPTKDDLGILHELKKDNKEIIVILNKVDKIKSSKYRAQIKKLEVQLPGLKLIPYSSTKKIGVQELTQELLGE
ncbi:MAG: GTP-binding protein [Patiriisocius sp.]|jgi:GTP-binding protein